ncbi:MAG: hypothetical protein ACYDC1_04955 [Limisphaerales bacterium]
MNTIRLGKIARLPRAIRDPLNRRLQDGETGPPLLEWLNSLPEVQEVLGKEFGGRPVNAQNLSDWRRGGYRDWVAHQEALELAGRLAEDAADFQAEDRPVLSDTLSAWLAAQYAVAASTIARDGGARSLAALRRLGADVAELRRGDHTRERLRLMREEMAMTRERTKRQRVEEFWKWADSEVREQICRGFMTQAEKIEWLGRKMFGDDWPAFPAEDTPEAPEAFCSSAATRPPEGTPDQGESR